MAERTNNGRNGRNGKIAWRIVEVLVAILAAVATAGVGWTVNEIGDLSDEQAAATTKLEILRQWKTEYAPCAADLIRTVNAQATKLAVIEADLKHVRATTDHLKDELADIQRRLSAPASASPSEPLAVSRVVAVFTPSTDSAVPKDNP